MMDADVIQRLEAALQAENYGVALYIIESHEEHGYRLLWFEREKPSNIIHNVTFENLLDEQTWIRISKELHKRYRFSMVFFSLLVIGGSLVAIIEPDSIFYVTVVFLGMFIGLFMLIANIRYHHKMLRTAKKKKTS